MIRAQYILVCQGSGVLARIAVNDVPVLMAESGDSFWTTEHINPWLADEPTELRFEVAGSLVDRALAGELVVTLVAGVEGQAPQPLMQLTFPGDDMDMIVAENRWQIEHTMRVPGLLRPLSVFWPEASAIVLTDEDRVAIHELVMDVQRALDVMDTDVLEPALAFRFAEMARVYHVAEPELRAAVGAAIDCGVGEEEIDPESENGLADLDETMELHLVGRERLVWVTRSTFAEVLRIPAVKPKVTLPLYLAPREGRWTIVR